MGRGGRERKRCVRGYCSLAPEEEEEEEEEGEGEGEEEGCSTSAKGQIRKRRLCLREGEITDADLLRVAYDARGKWVELGVFLGLGYNVVRSEVGPEGGAGGGDHLRAFHVLQEWKGRAAEDTTFERLALALEEAQLSSCARKHCYVLS